MQKSLEWRTCYSLSGDLTANLLEISTCTSAKSHMKSLSAVPSVCLYLFCIICALVPVPLFGLQIKSRCRSLELRHLYASGLMFPSLFLMLEEIFRHFASCAHNKNRKAFWIWQSLCVHWHISFCLWSSIYILRVDIFWVWKVRSRHMFT